MEGFRPKNSRSLQLFKEIVEESKTQKSGIVERTVVNGSILHRPWYITILVADIICLITIDQNPLPNILLAVVITLVIGTIWLAQKRESEANELNIFKNAIVVRDKNSGCILHLIKKSKEKVFVKWASKGIFDPNEKYGDVFVGEDDPVSLGTYKNPSAVFEMVDSVLN